MKAAFLVTVLCFVAPVIAHASCAVDGYYDCADQAYDDRHSCSFDVFISCNNDCGSAQNWQQCMHTCEHVEGAHCDAVYDQDICYCEVLWCDPNRTCS